MSEWGREYEALLRAARPAEAPVGARERVLAAAEARLARRARLWPFLLAPALVAALVAAFLPREQASRAPAAVVAPPQVAPPPPPAVAPAAAPARVEVANGHALRVTVKGAQVVARGPAAFEVRDDAVVLSAGTLDVDGPLEVQGPRCEASVRGRGTVEVSASAMVVTVFAGSAEVVPAVAECRVVDLSAAGAPPPVRPRPSVSRALAPRAPPAPAAEPAPPSALARLTAAYEEALRLHASDPAAALPRWRALAGPAAGPLAEEIDLHLVDALVRLGRRDEARREARRFLERHPDSARADEIRLVVGP